MRHIKASEFKAKCLKLMDEVQATGEAIVVTKNGVPVVRLAPALPKKSFHFGMGRGAFEIAGDIVGPVLPAWDIDPGPAGLSGAKKTKRPPRGAR